LTVAPGRCVCDGPCTLLSRLEIGGMHDFYQLGKDVRVDCLLDLLPEKLVESMHVAWQSVTAP